MAKQVLKNKDLVFATGVFLQRDDSVFGGWIVTEIQDDFYHDGKLVNTHIDEKCNVSYYTEDEEEDTDE